MQTFRFIPYLTLPLLFLFCSPIYYTTKNQQHLNYTDEFFISKNIFQIRCNVSSSKVSRINIITRCKKELYLKLAEYQIKKRIKFKKEKSIWRKALIEEHYRTYSIPHTLFINRNKHLYEIVWTEKKKNKIYNVYSQFKGYIFFESKRKQAEYFIVYRIQKKNLYSIIDKTPLPFSIQLQTE